MDTFKLDEKITKKSDPGNDEDIANKGYEDREFSRVEGHRSYIAKSYNEFELRSNKSSEEVFIERAVKTTFQILFDERFFDNYDEADEVLKKLSTY